MYKKEPLFLRKSVKGTKISKFGTNGSFCCTWEHEVPIYLGEKEQLVPICST